MTTTASSQWRTVGAPLVVAGLTASLLLAVPAASTGLDEDEACTTFARSDVGWDWNSAVTAEKDGISVTNPAGTHDDWEWSFTGGNLAMTSVRVFSNGGWQAVELYPETLTGLHGSNLQRAEFCYLVDVEVPTGKLAMTGDVGDFIPDVIDDPVHDPALTRDGDTYYVFSTGILRNPQNPGGIFARRSTGSIAGPWESLGEIAVPEWTRQYDHSHLWAPHVVERDGVFYLYYAASSFGRNTSAIGVASTQTPGDLDSWIDHGPVVTSQQDVHDYNAIDPQVFEAGGEWWIAFGSHWTGIRLQRLASMTEATGPVLHLADRQVPPNAIEAPTIFQRGGYYYLLTSWDQCCAGTNSTYKIAVGRSESATGPYVDRDGAPLLEGGGTLILESHGNQIGPGGQDIHTEFGVDYLVHHYYDGDANGVIRMQIRSLAWHDGWPSVELG